MKINSQNRQTFQGVRLNVQTFDRFQEYALKNNFLENFPRLFQPENFVNEGKFNKVYRIPDNPNFLLRVRKSPTPEPKLDFGPVEDVFPNLNVGQEIARLNENVSVVIAQQGEPCGVRHFSGDKLFPFQPEDKPQFIKYISKIAGFPLKAYEDLVKEAQLIGKIRRVDIQNPQNILYDAQNNCFNIVDVSPKDKLRGMLSPMALASLLCDFSNLFSVLKISDAQEQGLVLKSVSSVVKNVKLASENNGLESSVKPYLHKIYVFFQGRQEELFSFFKFKSLYARIGSEKSDITCGKIEPRFIPLPE